jgi:hypothetical protein
MRRLGVTAHVAQHSKGRRSAIDRRSTTRHPDYAIGQRIRKRIEEVFGWGKEVAGMRRTRMRGLARVGWAFTKRLERPPPHVQGQGYTSWREPWRNQHSWTSPKG